MNNFFSKLSDWDDGDVNPTMQAGTELIMSFMKQEDKAEQVTDVLERVKSFIELFQEYVNPIGVIENFLNAMGEQQ